MCPSGETTNGIDVSGYDDVTDWSSIKSSGVDFAIAKATEGVTIIDDDFAYRWPRMQSAGVIRTGYHFFHSADDGTMQADYFLAEVNAAGGFAPGDLPPALDWEVTDPGTTVAQAITGATAFLAEIKAKTGMTSIIYTSQRVWNLLGNPPGFTEYPIWIANYTYSLTICPLQPEGWATWNIWQWSDMGTVPGVMAPSSVDLNVYNGSLAQLQQFVAQYGPQATADGGESDAGAVDAGLIDAGAFDAGVVDAGSRTVDAGPMEAESPDSGTPKGRGDHESKPSGCASGGSPEILVLAMVALLLSRKKGRVCFSSDSVTAG